MTAPIALLGRNFAEDLVEGLAEVFVLYITVSTLSVPGGNRVRLQWPLNTAWQRWIWHPSTTVEGKMDVRDRI